MAYRELHVVEIKEILRLWALGHGLRTVASRTGTDRKTVRRYIDAAKQAGLERGDTELAIDDGMVGDVVAAIAPGAPRTVGAMRQHCRKNAAMLKDWVAEGCKGPKLVRLLKQHTKVSVPLRTLQRFVDEELTKDTGTVRLVEAPPGQVLEVDFLELGQFRDAETGELRKMHALLCTAVSSRHQFVWPCLTQTQEDVIDGLEAAWAFFGGVFPVLLPDNLKPVVTRADAVEPVFSEVFVEYAQARGFDIDPARVRKPKDKAHVERQVQYVRNDFFGGERFGSVHEARAEAVRWCVEEAGQRKHGRTGRKPVEVFEVDEQPLLKPAPAEPYDIPTWTSHTLGRGHAVLVDYVLYSVPYTIEEGTKLRVRSDRTTVKFYAAGQLVKMHPRKPRGSTQFDAADLPPDKAALAMRDPTPIVAQAAQFGANVGEYARRLADGPLPWTRMRFVYKLLGLARRYGGELTDEACARALEVGVVDVMRVSRMLERGLVDRGLLAVPSPRPPQTGPRFARKAAEFRTNGVPDATS